MGLIRVSPSLAIDDRAIAESFVRASGPGGQNVTKVSTAVQGQVDVAATGLPEAVRARLTRLAGRRMTQAGMLLISAQRHRSQERNRAQALDTLLALVRRAATPPVKRIPTRPGRAAKERRLEAKAHRGAAKRRRAVPGED